MNDDIVIIERNALADLVTALKVALEVVLERQKKIPLTKEENDRFKYCNKCLDQAIESFDKFNPTPTL